MSNVSSQFHWISSGHPIVSEIAGEILKQGGNAFDAAVAGGFASAVAEPTLTGLAGGGFMTASGPNLKPTVFDFFVNTPGLGRKTQPKEPHFFSVNVNFGESTQEFHAGLASAAVPGTLQGYLYIQRRLGRLPLKDILAPSIQLAKNGIELNKTQAFTFVLLYPILELSKESKALYEPDGKLLVQGDKHKNAELADFLDHLARDRKHTFHFDVFSKAIHQLMTEQNGLISDEDLKNYRVIEREPLFEEFGKYKLATNPLPSLGGSLLGRQMHHFSQNFGADQKPLGPEYFEAIARSNQLADQDRTLITQKTFSRGTTHLSVSDTEGNVASLSTSNGEGCGYLIPGTGIMLNNMLGEDDLHPEGFHQHPPGMRVCSMMSPTVVYIDDRPVLALGSGGSKRIRTSVFQVICHRLFAGLPLDEAVEHPRIHWDGELLQVEPFQNDKIQKHLDSKFKTCHWPSKALYFGGVHCVAPGTGAAGDSRREGGVYSVRS